ncbi:hypothetical protein HOLleu_33371 [Holothuria leucospilota]|uniref:Uncharacterized protein n=1 Tax=Holothuria leucospilota TaxID=206669 RepID=A0A9Q0YNH8_HOLLE|nr:hypothetical protein HOLleu_33371 [Holothuria leucospilota]
MESETRPLVPREEDNRKQIPLLLMMVMWSLGIVEWSVPLDEEEGSARRSFIGNSKWRRRFVFMLSISYQIGIVFVSFAGALWYLVCYFGKTDHLIRFLSVVLCYWPTVMSLPMFCLAAFARNNRKRHDDGLTSIAWTNVFNESSFVRQFSYLNVSKMKPLPKIGVVIFFYGFASSISCFIVLLYVDMYKSCESWISYIWMVGEVIALFYFATFSYFLYLKRIILEEEGRRTLSFVKSNKGNLEICIVSVKSFFCNYMQLRNMLLPWLCIVMFSSTFGLTVFLTWAYKDKTSASNIIVQVNTTTQIPDSNMAAYIGRFCDYACDGYDILMRENTYIVYSVILVGKFFMPAAVTFFVVRGLDVKHVWDRLNVKLHLMFSTHNLEFWKRLTKYVEKLHPDVTFSAFAGLVIPVLGLATGLLGSHHFKF